MCYNNYTYGRNWNHKFNSKEPKQKQNSRYSCEHVNINQAIHSGGTFAVFVVLWMQLKTERTRSQNICSKGLLHRSQQSFEKCVQISVLLKDSLRNPHTWKQKIWSLKSYKRTKQSLPPEHELIPNLRDLQTGRPNSMLRKRKIMAGSFKERNY